MRKQNYTLKTYGKQDVINSIADFIFVMACFPQTVFEQRGYNDRQLSPSEY